MSDPSPAAEPAPGGAKGETTAGDPTPAQRTVARRTAEARATIPDLELSLEVGMQPALERCAAEGCSLDALLLGACAAGLRAVPRANGAYRDGRLEQYSRVNVGWVVASGDTYVIPTVFDADTKLPLELTAEIEALTARALERALPPPAFAGATFTFWNAGPHGVTQAGIVINPPQAGALAAGAVREVPVARDGRVTIAPVMTLTLACDHRVLYGALAGEFLRVVRGALERPV